MNNDQILSQSKFEALKEELFYLTGTKRQEIAKNLEYAKSLGDLSENAEYHEARAEQAEVEGRIKAIEHLIKNARVIEHTSTEQVEVGSTVTLKKKASAATVVYHIVGSEESDILKGNISYRSPIGTALIGKKKGDKVTIEIPKGTVEYQIVDLS